MQDVYAEDLVHRSPGDASTLAAVESGFEPLATSWVEIEAMADSAEDVAGKSFTRVLIGQVKPNILRQIADQWAMKQLRRDLGHLYHYYLHGPQGSRSHGQAGSQPRDGTLPEILIQSVIGGRAAWSVNLADVTDDLESQYLQVLRDPNRCICFQCLLLEYALCFSSPAGLCCRSVLLLLNRKVLG